MRKAQIIRTHTGPEGTFGIFQFKQFRCVTVEPPWKDNEPFHSCIPTGVYVCRFIVSSDYGRCYWLQEVPGRSDILIHSGNVAGDVRQDYKTHSAGCILPGEHFGTLWGQRAVILSSKTKSRIMELMKSKSFKLKITEMY